MRVTVTDDEGVVLEEFQVHAEPRPTLKGRLIQILQDAVELARLGLTEWEEDTTT